MVIISVNMYCKGDYLMLLVQISYHYKNENNASETAWLDVFNANIGYIIFPAITLLNQICQNFYTTIHNFQRQNVYIIFYFLSY